MAEHAPAPAVALLFADAELGSHLREALQALDATIVHEGPATAVRREDLAAADVVVVNLDAKVEDTIEQLYAALDESRQRVVFNDAQASRGLTGWDRARWARHLAAKLVDAGDVDPPRPAPAPGSPALQVEQRQTVATPAPPVEWDLVDFEAAPVAPVAREDSAAFGIEKLAAAEFLAPDAASADPTAELISTLELVSMEEAVAPVAGAAPVGEDGNIRRLLLLGAAAEGAGAIRELLAGLPPMLPALVLVAQHQRDQATAAQAAELAATTRLPVRVAEDGMRAQAGEVVLLPAGQQVTVGRNGRVHAQAVAAKGPCDPSIDHCFTMAAAAFGADVVAIILAGDANDAIAGAQAVHDRGGRVWAEDASPSTANDMVAVAREEGLVDFSGTPAALLARLREEYA
ncbi:MAG TPA: chemotaxis protein CheB [Rhodanobacteraceae bacterium]|nr:chemotaxis protein CheB [Rhodanobacteraceae bacterium]